VIITIPFFEEIYKQVRILDFQNCKMDTTIPKKTPYLTPCLPLVEPEKETVDETRLVTFSLEVRVGSAATVMTYKMKVAKFGRGTPAIWIKVNLLNEIWAQNGMTTATDREASVKTILREDASMTFKASIEESRDGNEAALPLSPEMVDMALTDVSRTVFPHRALEIQKLWMRRAIRKPKEMLFRKLVAAVTKMNKSLAKFPGARDDDKFSNSELLGIIEWALPVKWRAKFDLVDR
jgi:hypothetical protein